ncbi:MAG: 3-deoxy-D-manno-octulosonic acid transferase [Chitinophagaceae bacterium]|nr:MAG: 3-deoxy-D-manno-octulosonic acid transferase [Chitinophagaceae bacterium]
MVFFYNLFITLYGLLLRLAAPFVPKAKAWRAGRRRWEEELQKKRAAGPWIWMHCASAGEFEQGKPVLEALRAAWPGHRILVSFFSPSGYEVGVKYKGADAVTFLPLDTAANARRFVSIVDPALVVFVKYDFWYHHLKAVHERGIPLLLVSALFRPGQSFFKWYGGVQRRLLHFFTRLFVQDDTSVSLLKSIGVTHCSAAGDTRFDRVATITQAPAPLPLIEAFAQHGSEPILVAGSTWPEDEALIEKLPWQSGLRLIIAPHEIDIAHIDALRARFGAAAVAYSELELHDSAAALRVLIIDNFGMLSRLYRYGSITYIGGGFNKSGIHNTLEAAAWGKPVIFGPNYQKFREARELVAARAAFSVSTSEKLAEVVDSLLAHSAGRREASEAAARYVQQNIGATPRIIAWIQEKRLLTN